VSFDLGRILYEKLLLAPDFEPLHQPQCNIVAFRYLPAELEGATPQEQGDFQRRLRRRVIESGAFYLVAANINGTDALRVTLMNPLTTEEHLDQLMNTLRTVGRELLCVGQETTEVERD
jgi:L-2,4-diaminobutyrate decarboxylase